MNLVFWDFQRHEQKFVRETEIAFLVIRRHTTLVRPEKMYVSWEGRRAAVPNFSRPGLFYDRSEKFLRDAAARERNAMRFACAIRRRNSIQPCVSGGSRQFVGGGEGKQFKIVHLGCCGSCQTRPPWASKSSAAIGPHVPAA